MGSDFIGSLSFAYRFTYNGENVRRIATSFLIGASPGLQVTKTVKKSRISSISG